MVINQKYMKSIFNILLILFFTSCSSDIKTKSIVQFEGIEGKEQFKSTSYITAGDRVYAIGSQDGTFPEIGWHIKNEMGGVWNHPIKLLDGYNARITNGKNSEKLNNAKFINYPFGNKFLYELNELDLSVEQFQFSPDQHQGIIIEYLITNESDENFFGLLEFESSFDLRPTWLGERTGMNDGDDYIEYDLNNNQIVAKDRDNPWFSSLSSSEPITSFEHSVNSYTGKGASGIATIQLSIESRTIKRLQFYISGSYNSLNESLNELKIIKSSSDQLFNDKISKFNDIEFHSKLTTSDPEFDQVFRWLKFNSDWFIREVPEIGRGIAAGYPDYPWWFGCDSEYALKGYLSIGAFDLVTTNINLLSSLSNKANENGRIIHEASTNGSVFNPGNLNETPQFASLIWEAYRWTGNKSLLSENFSLIRQGLNWTLNENDIDENGFPEGAGMMEIHGLESEMIDVASYTQRGFQDASKIAAVLGDSLLSIEYETLAKSLRRKINDSFWVEDFNSFADFIASDKQTLHLIDNAIVRADTLNKPWAVEELNQTKQYIINNPSDSIRPFVLHHNWVVNTPMEMGIADSDKAQKALNTAEKFVNPYGVFVTGIDRDDTAGKDVGSFKGSKVFSYTGAVMTLPTGVSAISENNYGNPDKALDYLKRMGRSFSFALPGSIYEVSPDYGMFAQAWNLYSYAVPVVQQFFGINPDAAKNHITISPLMPSSWETAKLENVKVGNNKISLEYKKSSNGYTIGILSENENWNIIFEPKENEVIISQNSPTPSYTIYEVTTDL